MKNFISSDWHLGHKNIMDYDNRKEFKTLDEHDWYIINRSNELVSDEDNLYLIGDFALTKKTLVEHYLQHLRGKLFFIKGNHDKRDNIKLFEKYGIYLGEQKKIEVEEKVIILNHFAMRVWDRSHKGSIHLYGHSHDSLEHVPYGLSMDVGIMSAKRLLKDYQPFDIVKDIFPIMENRSVKLVDRHGTRKFEE